MFIFTILLLIAITITIPVSPDRVPPTRSGLTYQTLTGLDSGLSSSAPSSGRPPKTSGSTVLPPASVYSQHLSDGWFVVSFLASLSQETENTQDLEHCTTDRRCSIKILNELINARMSG